MKATVELPRALALIALSFLTVVGYEAHAREGVVVMPVTSTVVAQADLNALHDLLVLSASEYGDLDVTTLADIEAELGRELLKDQMNCDDVKCAAEIGGALGKRYLLTAAARKLGSNFMLVLNLIDTSTGTTKRSIGKGSNKPETWDVLVQTAVVSLLEKTKLRSSKSPEAASTKESSAPRLIAPGAPVLARFTSQPPGAVLLVDGKIRCRATPCQQNIAPGSHQVVVQKSGFASAEKTVEFRPGMLPVDIKLIQKQGVVIVTSVDAKGQAITAEVKLDGEALGNTPVSKAVGVGEHRLTLHGPGGSVADHMVSVREGKTTKLEATLRGGIAAEMVLVSGGKFTRGCSPRYDDQCKLTWQESPTDYEKVVTVPAFLIDKTEVTVAQYRSCVNAGRCSEPTDKPPTYKVRQYNWGAKGREKHPINGVNWTQAKNYCEWTGKHLPTEDQWEKAARGSDARVYPWGREKPSCAVAIVYGGRGGAGCDAVRTWPVCSVPQGNSPYGACDMSGNVWEWVDTPYKSNRPRDSGSLYRIARGGDYLTSPRQNERLRVYNRVWSKATTSSASAGFRCAKAAE